MSQKEIVSLNLAKHPYEFTKDFDVFAVDEAQNAVNRSALVFAEHWTVADLTGAGNYDKTTIRAVLGAADVRFIEAGELDADVQSSPLRSSIGIQFADGIFTTIGIHDRVLTASLTNGTPAVFERLATRHQQFRGNVADWSPTDLGEGPLRGIDFTDALLHALATYRQLELPRELRPVGRALTAAGKAAEVEKKRDMRDFLRQHFLAEKFAQNAGSVSVLAVVSGPQWHAGMHPLLETNP